MPHVIVKLWPGKTEQQKTELALTLAKFDLVLLFTVIADMVLKPEASDWPILLVMVLVLVAAAALWLTPVLRKSRMAA